ncbi:hypothetical protein [Moorena sp. SIO4G3]|uniref:hypothetical protein n=1 Tax=Moorena sp. SIO4G3 TaxID=2607821 RepID=UPI0014298E38|nr:hypothetical protein [Moorena sp. SIO4G3]NEO81246.1 hypothetical protein [Moorena sp. SIO4G3]
MGRWGDGEMGSHSIFHSYEVNRIFSRLPTPDSRLPTPDSRLPTPDSRLPIPYSLFPIPYSLFPTPYSLLPTPFAITNNNFQTTKPCNYLNHYQINCQMLYLSSCELP